MVTSLRSTTLTIVFCKNQILACWQKLTGQNASGLKTQNLGFIRSLEGSYFWCVCVCWHMLDFDNVNRNAKRWLN